MVLSQRGEDGQARPIHFTSRQLTPTEQRYSATERECLAIITSVDIFRPYLHGNKFTIYTDHQALVWLEKHKDEKSKLMRWFLRLQEYDFEIVYKA